MSLKKNLLYNFFLSFSQVAFPLISIPYITRVLDPAGIGKVGFIDSLTYYFIVIAEFGVAAYGIREVSRKSGSREELSKTVSELVSLHIRSSLASILLFLLTTAVLYNKVNDPRLLMFAISFLLVNSFACEWYFWGREKIQYIAVRSVITRLLGLASIFILVKQPADYVLYYGIVVGTAIVNLAWNFSKLLSELNISFKSTGWKKHLPFIAVTYKISLVYSIVLMLDNVFLRVLNTTAAVAYYMLAAKVVRIGGALITDSLMVFYPRTVSLLHRNEKEALQTTIIRSSQLVLLITIPMAVGIYVIAEKFTLVYFGPRFLPLAVNLKILALYPVLKAYSLFLNKQFLMPFDKEKLVLRSLVIGAVVFVVLTIPLSYYYADNGTSAAVMISELVVLLFNYHYVKELGSGIRMFDPRTAIEALGGALLFIPLLYFMDTAFDNQLAQLVIAVLICALVYFIFLAFIIKNSLVVSLFNSFKQRLLPAGVSR